MVRMDVCVGMLYNYMKNRRHLRMRQTLLENGFLLKLWPSLLTTITAYIRQLFKQLNNIAAIKRSVSSRTVSLTVLRQKRPKSQLMMYRRRNCRMKKRLKQVRRLQQKLTRLWRELFTHIQLIRCIFAP